MKFSKRNWSILILFGLIGQIAWSVENMYFNLFVFETIAPDLNAVTLMVQLSGVAATVTTLLAGTLSDKIGNRRHLISYGYIIWGITIGIFGFYNPSLIAKTFDLPITKAISFTLALVVISDCIMTMFGSTANDAAFNAWVTDNTDSSIRGKVESVLSILPLISMLIVAGGFGILVEFIGYKWLFITLGSLISLFGIVGLFTITDSPKLVKTGSLKDVVYGFKPSVIKKNFPFYVTLLIIGVYGIACQIFMPFLIIYMKTYLLFSVLEYSLLFGLAICLGALINIILGRLADKTNKISLLYISASILSIGLLGMFFVHFNNKALTLALFGICGLVMITGYIFTLALTGALVRDYTPEKDAGKMQGVRMIFTVLIPMIIGPMIGNAINQAAAIPLPDLESADVMTTSYIPSPYIFLAASITSALVLIIVPLLNKIIKKNSPTRTVILKTDYSVGKIPHSEHPLPQCQREDWLCLNGVWHFEKRNFNQTLLQENILVPFSPETLLSGIKDFHLESGETLYYKKEFTLDEKQMKGIVVLHFGAVDSECKIYINGDFVGEHVGGFTPFSFEVSSYTKIGTNVIEVEVSDEATRNGSARGKQNDNPGGYWYTPQSGIWQTVWLEFMPVKPIIDLKITPLFDDKTVKIDFNCEDEVSIVVFDEDKIIFSQSGYNSFIIDASLTEWTPEKPKLYNFELISTGGDKIKSYFGLRKFSILKDKNGKKRLGLNGKPYFYNGILDQGYWPEGLLTYPSDSAVYNELLKLKEMGFNTVRKHLKLEPMRWYYYCDKLGLAVWQDFINGGGEYKFSHVATLPFLGFNHNDNDYKYFAREDEQKRTEYYVMAEEIIATLYNCVSLAVYVPFNEGWGQFDSAKVTEFVRSKDSTRIIDSVSGWHDQGETKTEIKSLHTYYTPLKVPKDTRAVILSEFGGYSLKIDEHVYNLDKEFGYKKFKDFSTFEKAIEKLYLEKLMPLIEKGLSGAIYTQVSDVEEEINGLFTYDRKVQKISTETMKQINDKLKSVWNKIIQ